MENGTHYKYLFVYNHPAQEPRDGGEKGLDTGRRRFPCVAITLVVIDTGADLPTNKNTQTVEP
jgi:hypothetical protein